DVETRAAAANLDVALGLTQLDLDPVLGKRAYEIGQEPAGEEDGARSLDGRVELGAKADLSIGGAEGDGALRGGQQDSRQRLGRAAGRDRAGDGGELRGELLPLSDQLQRQTSNRVDLALVENEQREAIPRRGGAPGLWTGLWGGIDSYSGVGRQRRGSEGLWI